MKWIKASERKPDKTRVNIKFNGYPNVIYKVDDYRWAFDDYDGEIIGDGNWGYIEWLDESEVAPPHPVQSDDLPAGNKIFKIYKKMHDCPLKTFLHQWFDKYDPDSSVQPDSGVEEVLRNIRVYYAENNAGGKTMCYKYDDVYSAMQEYASLKTKELREALEKIKNHWLVPQEIKSIASKALK